MDKVRIFEKKNFSQIKDFQKEKPNAVMGVVYAIEYSGGYCKIGMSSFPADRTSVLKHYISDYMQKQVRKIMISEWHTNYRKNEKLLHEAFSDCRIPNTELFSVCVEEIALHILNEGILLEDRSEEILEEIKRESDLLIEFVKSVMRGDYVKKEKSEERFNFSEMYDNMLESADALTDEILFTAKAFIDDYKAALEDSMELELMKLKSSFVDKWVKYGLINEECMSQKPCKSKHGGRNAKKR